MSQKRIAFLFGGLSRNGGIGRVTSIIGNQLAEQSQYKVYFLTMEKWKPTEFIYSVSSKIIGSGWDDRETMSFTILHGGIKRLKKYVKDNDIDILVACGALYFPISVFACMGTKTKCVAWEHSNANNKADHKFQMESRWIGAKFADAVLVLSKADYKLYKKKYATKHIYQIYNPIDPEMKPQQAEMTSKAIISVGRLCYQKNYPALIKVAEKVLSACPSWRWDIYGEGPDREEIQKMINESTMSSKIQLKGQVSDIYERYSKYSMLVMTSRYEGFSMVLMEALYTGLPLIAFDVECGPNEIIENQSNGFLIQPFDIDTMAEKIIMLCNDEALRKKMSRKAMEESALFNIKCVVPKWIKMIAEVSDQ